MTSKIDKVLELTIKHAESIGNISGKIDGIKADISEVKNHVSEINGSVKRHRVDIELLKSNKWDWKKTSLMVGFVGAVVGIVASILA